MGNRTSWFQTYRYTVPRPTATAADAHVARPRACHKAAGSLPRQTKVVDCSCEIGDGGADDGDEDDGNVFGTTRKGPGNLPLPLPLPPLDDRLKSALDKTVCFL